MKIAIDNYIWMSSCVSKPLFDSPTTLTGAHIHICPICPMQCGALWATMCERTGQNGNQIVWP